MRAIPAKSSPSAVVGQGEDSYGCHHYHQAEEHLKNPRAFGPHTLHPANASASERPARALRAIRRTDARDVGPRRFRLACQFVSVEAISVVHLPDEPEGSHDPENYGDDQDPCCGSGHLARHPTSRVMLSAAKMARRRRQRPGPGAKGISFDAVGRILARRLDAPSAPLHEGVVRYVEQDRRAGEPCAHGRCSLHIGSCLEAQLRRRNLVVECRGRRRAVAPRAVVANGERT